MKPLGCIIALHGRGGSAEYMSKTYKAAVGLEHTEVMGCSHPHGVWYPQPWGPKNQEEALCGLPKARNLVEATTTYACDVLNITPEQCALVGFSAGAVVALYTAITSEFNYAAVVSHSGAILNPTMVPSCKKKLHLLLFHSRNDPIFSWEERYLPTKETLLEQKWNASFAETETGGHHLYEHDIMTAGLFLAPIFHYPPTWRSPLTKTTP